jgi:hypothetical protein
MLKNYRCKNTRDIETAEESMIFSSSFKSALPDAVKSVPKPTITYQRENDISFDNYLEKRK